MSRISYHYDLKVTLFYKLQKQSECINLRQAAHFAHAKNLVCFRVGKAGIPDFELPLLEVGELKNNYTRLRICVLRYNQRLLAFDSWKMKGQSPSGINIPII